MRIASLLLLAGLAPSSAWAAEKLPAECARILPDATFRRAERPLQPEDLVALRDIGPVDSDTRSSPLFALSPDGRRAAFQLHQADPTRNRYCLAMVVVDLVPNARGRVIDAGGDLLLLTIDLRGKANFSTGIPMAVTPRWSSDGKWIAFLKRTDGRTQVWRAEADGSGSAPLTSAPSDVVDFSMGGDGSTLVYATRSGVDRAQEAADREALSGYHYDDRFSPVASSRPFAVTPIATEVTVLEIATGHHRLATASEARLVGGEAKERGGGEPSEKARARRLWISATSLTGGAKPLALHAAREGRTSTCGGALCEGATSPLWGPDGRSVLFFRREGWDRTSTGIYQWEPVTGRTRRLYSTEDVLADCAPTGAALVCLREGSTQPRRLERLDPHSGRRDVLFDPNAEFANLELGLVQRLHWKNEFGLDNVGDLVLPTRYRPGSRYPLIVVQYDTRGFLRGGTGDDYPIQAFANRGYAVLSVRRPQAIAFVRGAQDFREGDRLNLVGFADRRNALTGVEEGVRLAIARGVADPARIGITGLSNGASTVVHALLHSSLFAAAAMSTCCTDVTQAARVGPAAARDFYRTGYPRMTDRNETFWKEISLSLNAKRIKTPILLQLSDDESMSALDSYTALREVGAPIDMFIFPNEHHVKWQPAHRLAVYRRSLDWFDYWLRTVRSPAPDRQADLLHWDTLREASLSGRPN